MISLPASICGEASDRASTPMGLILFEFPNYISAFIQWIAFKQNFVIPI
jgi:hypothetical protein